MTKSKPEQEKKDELQELSDSITKLREADKEKERLRQADEAKKAQDSSGKELDKDKLPDSEADKKDEGAEDEKTVDIKDKKLSKAEKKAAKQQGRTRKKERRARERKERQEHLKQQREKRMKRVVKKKKKKKKKFSLRGFTRVINLKSFLNKAGVDADPKDISKKIFRISIVLSLLASLAAIIMSVVNAKGLANLLVFLLGFWLTIPWFLLAFLWAVYLFYIDMKIYQRTKAIEEVFPDFLQLTSANISAGMPIDRALWYAVRPGFGVLAKEIETVAKNTMAGEDLGTALREFANKYDSEVIQRSINLLLEGMAAGGEMADLLSKISLNIEETRILKKEMAASVTTYVIFIAFATIMAAPVLFGLATQLLVVIKQITSSLGSSMASSGSMFGFSFSSAAIEVSDFKLFSYAMLIISSFSSACIVSVIRKGRVREGLTQIPVYILVSIVIYTLALLLMNSLFSNFV